MKTAVVYYSKSGTTLKVVEAIKSRFDSDLFFVEPAEAYEGGYLSTVAKVGQEKLTGKLMALKSEPADFSDYKIIFIGFPVWYGTMPSFMQEYVKKSKLDGKIIIPFVTAGGSGKTSSLETVKNLLPNSKVSVSHYYFSSRIQEADMNAWLDGLEKIIKAYD
ncbi:MAG: hypothetical protein K5989_05965 [Lachnospiraceae bacterium]|nr:hypothetical protein [Lachnospiraceae bacterium]